MERKTLSIPNISCKHCVMTIKNELSELPGVVAVEGSPESKTVDVQWESPASLEKIKASLEEIDYPSA